MTHDPLCPVAAGPCCPWMGDCACQCRCEEYAKVREDVGRRARDGVMRLPYEIEDEIVVVRDDVLAWIDAAVKP